MKLSPLVIQPFFYFFLFTSELSIIVFIIIIYTFDLIGMQIICNCIDIYKQISVFCINKKANLYIDHKNSINICLILYIS